MIPNLFVKQELPSKIPKELELKIKEFSRSKNKEEFLKKSFFYVVRGWGGSRFNFFFKFTRLFQKDISQILRTKGYMHCTTMNFLIRIMLIRSGLFKESDIRLIFTNSWYIVPHQYMVVRVSEKKFINIDPWYYQFGIDYGEYGSGFSSMIINPIR